MKEFVLKTSLWLIAAVLLQACVPLVPTPLTQSLPPDQLGTVVAGTAAAAQTQTAALLSPTFTVTPTRTPSRTPTAVTPTVTFFFALPTFTPTITETSIVPTSDSGSGSNRGGPTPTRQARAQWQCEVIGTNNPRNPLVVNPRSNFSILVRLRNIGSRTWTNNGVDFVYRGGFRHEGTRIQDLPDTIVPGNSITLRIQFEAPKKLGLYKANWSLQVGNHPFCGLRVAFEVK